MIRRGELGLDDHVGITKPLRRVADFPAFAQAAAEALAAGGDVCDEPVTDAQGESDEQRTRRREAERRQNEATRAAARRDIERNRESSSRPPAEQGSTGGWPNSGVVESIARTGAVEAPRPRASAPAETVETAERPPRSTGQAETIERPPRATGQAKTVERLLTAPPTSRRERSRSESISTEGPTRFLPEVIGLGGAELRDWLLEGSVEEILGLRVTAPRREVSEAMSLRKAQLDEHPAAESASVSDRVGLIDAHRIVIAAYELVRDPRSVREYMSACRSAESGIIPFGEYVRFEPSLLDTGAMRRVRTKAPTPIKNREGQPVAMRQQAVDVLDDAMRLVRQVEDARERRISEEGQGPPQKRGRRLAAVSAGFRAPPIAEGDANRGPLTYGVGDLKAGLLTVGPALLVLFGVVLILMVGTRFDQFEGHYDGRSPLAWIRAATMLVLAVGSVRLFRRESLSRLGWSPPPKAALVVMATLPALWFVAGAVLPFEVKGEAALATILAVVLARGISEALFFEGLVHRTLLVEAKSAPVVHAVSVSAYVVYMNTYRFLWDPADPQYAGGVLYGFVVALPAAYVFYRTRSWLMSALVRVAALGGAAWTSFQMLG